ncbi:LysR substrate-binding domain-containing protein [Novosphingobium rosa]|uniref:LysR substrate-binding domain-containing protein n=1 Tax=Novosphingobium rosa TaxID=76978 RepID=UPI000A85F24B|nr:LysR substrate-binding domain-containing protein [Novosphingobium rosa]
MMDMNDFAFFAAVVQHGGFTAATRATGVDKGRLSRHVAQLEERLGIRLLQRSTRSITLTEAGKSFYEGCLVMLDGARIAYDSALAFSKEPTGTIRVGCPVVVAQNYLAPILPHYMEAHPKVSVVVEATDRLLHPFEEGFDAIITAQSHVPDSTSLVAREIGRIRRLLVAKPGLLGEFGAPDSPEDLAGLPVIARQADMQDEQARWSIINDEESTHRLQLNPRLVTTDLQIQLSAAKQGIGVALLPAPLVKTLLANGDLVRVLPDWHAPEYSMFLIYARPRGMLPSVRSFIDFVLENISVE